MNFRSQSFHPSRESLRRVEDCAKNISPQEKYLEEWHSSYISNHKFRIASDLDIVNEQVKRGSSILEFGSIPLLFTSAVSSGNYNVTGIDKAPERYKSAIENTGLRVIKCDIETEKLPFADNSFDAIVFNELFEHLRINLIFTLSEVFRVLRFGGVMMLSSPNLRSLNGLYNFLVKNRAYSCCENPYEEYQKLEKLGHMGHVREYTTTEIIDFLTNVGFDTTSVIYRGQLNTKFKNLLAMAFPSLRPFVSYVSLKPAKKPEVV
jgi:ubiquinone/menaquinone biosynthesis C-methylase UbiE